MKRSYNFRFDEAILALLLTLAHFGSLFLWFYDIKELDFFILNPLLFMVMGWVIYNSESLYITNNDYSYFKVSKIGTQKYGAFLIHIGFFSFIIFNFFYTFSSTHTYLSMLQLIASFGYAVYISEKHAEKKSTHYQS